MLKVTVVKYDSKMKDYCFTDIIGVYSSRKKATAAIQKLMLYAEEDLDEQNIQYCSLWESDKCRGKITTDKIEYSYYCVDYPFDALETVRGIEAI
jgi:hypothetical protein